MFKDLKQAYADTIGPSQAHCFMCCYLAGLPGGDNIAWTDPSVDVTKLEPRIGKNCGRGLGGSNKHSVARSLPPQAKLEELFKQWRKIKTDS